MIALKISKQTIIRNDILMFFGDGRTDPNYRKAFKMAYPCELYPH